MVQAYIDHVSNLACKEKHGAIRSLTRKVRINFVQSDITSAKGYDALSVALDVLDDAGITPMSTLAYPLDETERWGSLCLVDRDPSVIDGDPKWVDVILEYQHLVDGPNQTIDIDGNPTGLMFGKGKASIVDKTTNFFYPFGDHTLPKTQILVAHQFPTWEVGIVASPFDPAFPRTVFQGGDISIPFPQQNYSFSAIVSTGVPSVIASELVASINELPWLGQDSLKWICSEVQWQLNAPTGDPSEDGNLRSPNYQMSFEFQYNVDGWDPVVAFLDHRTGRPPNNIEFADTNTSFALPPGDPDNPNPPINVMNMYSGPDEIYFTDEGVIMYGVNPIPGPRPAGLWQVPALVRVDFDDYFALMFS